LTVINGYADLLLSPNEPPENEKYLRLIRDAGRRATTLAARLLAFSRPKAEESRIVNLNDVVTDMSTLLRRLLPANIEFAHKLEPRLDSVRADAGLMEQVLMNLVVNARDAMPAGGRLEMQTANVEPDAGSAGCEGMPRGRYVALTITDTGVGMDESARVARSGAGTRGGVGCLHDSRT
jgi:two-component system cell cycle sensor histidine kinase/response regulator CckA